MWSFKYPDQLLHGTTEKEWFPPSNDEKESRLDSLEREEEANKKRMRKIAQTKAKQPIGLATGNKKGAAASDTPNITGTTTQVDASVVLEPPPRPRIWNMTGDASMASPVHPRGSPARGRTPSSPSYSPRSLESSTTSEVSEHML